MFFRLLFSGLFTIFVGSYSTKANESIRKSDSITVTIEALDLSEDMSRISSKNDEIFLLIYQWEDSLELGPTNFHMSTILSEGQRLESVTKPFLVSESSAYFLILIERDSDRPLTQIDPIIRVHHKVIRDAFKTRDYKLVESYLGDEDVLGYSKVLFDEAGRTAPITFKGIHRLDTFEYLISIQLE